MQFSNFSHQSSKYPDMLRILERPPASINVLGTLPKGIYVSIVGSRKPTAYGKQVTYMIARELAQAGAVIVSGLADGIDGIAHQATIDAGGKTVAVLAHGLDRIYPHKHRDLATDIIDGGGALITEYPVGATPLPYRFVERNRIIAALCTALIVPEATVDSGSLITASIAKDQCHRDILAVPGNITCANAAGPNNLIRSGARAIMSTADVINELGFLAREAVPVSARSPHEARILDLLSGGSATNSDTIIEASGLSPQDSPTSSVSWRSPARSATSAPACG
jgi:DNA processing protein